MQMKPLMVVATVALALVATTAHSRQPQGRSVATVAIRCSFAASPAVFESRVTGVEIAGRIRRIPDIRRDMSCTEAFQALGRAGFGIVHSSSSPAGPVTDGDDFVLWQRNSGGSIP